MGEKIEKRVLKELNEQIIENAPISVIIIDKKGVITFTNEYFKKLTENPGIPEGKNIAKIPFFVRENLCQKYKKLLTQGIPFNEEACLTKNLQGKKKYINIIAVPVRNKNGKIKSALSMALDVTDLVLTKNKLKRLKMNLVRFVSETSHELKTPISIIKLSLEFIEKELAKVPELKIIDLEINKITALLTDLNLLAKIENSPKKIFCRVELNKLIQNTIRELRILADKKNVAFILKSFKKTLFIKGNKEELAKLFSNIILNAIKYNKNGGWVNICLRADQKTNMAVIDVADNGIGIPKKDLPRIFDRFYRSELSKRKEEGVGLGLAICKSIVEQYNGSISTQSQAGKGSLFSIKLPID